MGLTAGPDVSEKRNYFYPSRETKRSSSIVEPVAQSSQLQTGCTIIMNITICIALYTGLSKKMDGIVYLYLLERYVFPQIETFEQEIVSRVIFMQDGAPPHFSCFVTDVLNERFRDAWIGRGGPIPWPPRSPDLST